MTGKLEMHWIRGFACRTCFSKPIFHTITHRQYTNFERKAPNFAQIGCFLPWFAQNTPNSCTCHVIWSPSSLMKPTDRYHTKYCEIAPEKGYIYIYHVNVRIPPPPVWQKQWYGWRRVTERKRRHNLGGGKRKEWTFKFDRHHIRSWWTDL